MYRMTVILKKTQTSQRKTLKECEADYNLETARDSRGLNWNKYLNTCYLFYYLYFTSL